MTTDYVIISDLHLLIKREALIEVLANLKKEREGETKCLLDRVKGE